MRALLLCVASLVAVRAQDGLITCDECSTIQEGIFRTIVHNITVYEKRAVSGTATTERIEIGQLIWHLCGSKTWKARRLTDAMTQACHTFVREHVDVATRYWQEKSAEEYKDPVIALQMKKAVCTNPDIGACTRSQLPDAYTPLRADECSLCNAVVADLYGVVSKSTDQPTSGRADPYFRLVGVMAEVCAELPMRHEIRPNKRSDVEEGCQDFWDDYESTLTKLALKRELSFARGICSKVLHLCDGPDTSATGLTRDEL
jgi:hypothetical protein